MANTVYDYGAVVEGTGTQATVYDYGAIAEGTGTQATVYDYGIVVEFTTGLPSVNFGGQGGFATVAKDLGSVSFMGQASLPPDNSFPDNALIAGLVGQGSTTPRMQFLLPTVAFLGLGTLITPGQEATGLTLPPGQPTAIATSCAAGGSLAATLVIFSQLPPTSLAGQGTLVGAPATLSATTVSAAGSGTLRASINVPLFLQAHCAGGSNLAAQFTGLIPAGLQPSQGGLPRPFYTSRGRHFRWGW